jgi:VanZ family protein
MVVAWLAFRPSTGAESGLPWDKANHALAFVVLTTLAGRGWPALSRTMLVLIMLAAGVGIELIQGLPQVGRDADVWDVAADAVGIAAGLALLSWLQRRRPGVRG